MLIISGELENPLPIAGWHPDPKSHLSTDLSDGGLNFVRFTWFIVIRRFRLRGGTVIIIFGYVYDDLPLNRPDGLLLSEPASVLLIKWINGSLPGLLKQQSL